jgi:glutathione S-transferase
MDRQLQPKELPPPQLRRLARAAGHLSLGPPPPGGGSAACAATGAAAGDAEAPRLVVGYWSIRGLGAPLRMMCEYAGVPYEAKLFDDDQPEAEQWPAYKAELSKKNPLANLPFVIDGDVVVTQSNACLTYLAGKLGLMGAVGGARGGPLAERALVEQCLCQVMDLRNDAVALFYGNQIPFTDPPVNNPDENAAVYLSDTVSVHYGKLEAWLELHGTTFLAGATPTAADFHLFEMLDQHSAFAVDFGLADPIDTCPRLDALASAFRALPQLAGYFAGPLHALPMNHAPAALWGGEAR